MKEILLIQDQVVLVDDEDFERLSQWSWCAHWRSSTKSFIAVRGEGKNLIRMFREIMDCPDDLLVDHKNHDTLDNQKCNLRICTDSQNQQNKRKRDGCSSIYKGVYWYKARNKWRARIFLRNIFDQTYKHHLGSFDIEEEAALAYDEAAIEYFGEFAYLNFLRQQ